MGDFISIDDCDRSHIWHLIPGLRWKRKSHSDTKTNDGGVDDDVRVDMVLQELWQNVEGREEWRDVEIVEE